MKSFRGKGLRPSGRFEERNGGLLTARVEDWHVPPVEIKLLGIILGLPLFALIIYLLGPVWREQGEYLVLFGVLVMGTGLLIPGAKKPRSRKVSHLAAALILLGGGPAFGSIAYMSDSLLVKLSLSVGISSFFILFAAGQVWVSKTQERMKILVDGDYSLELLRELTGKIKSSLSRNGVSYAEYHNSIQLDLDKKERIIIAVIFEEVLEKTEYKLILRAIGSRESSTYALLKKEISEIVYDIEREKGIDSYPKVKRVVCMKCRRDVSYVVATDQFYCMKCRKYEKEKDVYVVGSEL